MEQRPEAAIYVARSPLPLGVVIASDGADAVAVTVVVRLQRWAARLLLAAIAALEVFVRSAVGCQLGALTAGPLVAGADLLNLVRPAGVGHLDDSLC